MWEIVSSLVVVSQTYQFIKDNFLNNVAYKFRVYYEKLQIDTWNKNTWVGAGACNDPKYVKKVQKLLNLALPNSVKLDIDGLAGYKTQAKIKEFQRKHYLPEDGCCGEATYKELLNLD